MKIKNIIVSALMALAVGPIVDAAPAAEKIPSFAAQPSGALAKAVADFSPANLDLSGDVVKYKNLPAGVKVSIAATTYEQLISPAGKIRHPISPKKTKVTFKISRGNDSALTQTFEIAVPVKSTKSGGNAKPAVIPALQEWTGAAGTFKAGKNCKIVISDRDAKQGKPNFEKRMKLFASELGSLVGGKIEVKVVPASEMEAQSGGNAIVLQILPKNAELQTLGKEGYKMAVRGNGIRVESCDATGAFWATRSILQVLVQNKNAFPCGNAVDYPQYPVRGFMLDVGRKPVSMDTLKNTMRTMAYYKMNDFQVHLNDNLIWMGDYTKIPSGPGTSKADQEKAIKEVLAAAPTAFRMESKIPGLTATDLFYTKKEFGEFIDLAKLYGVGIVPEFDAPGHAMSLIKVRPELMYRGALSGHHNTAVERTAMLDLSNDKFKGNKTYCQESLEFVKSIFDEYLKPQNGQEPVFRDCKIHIGTDEYYGNAEDYRAFAAEMLNYMKKIGRTPRLWGSFSYKPGKTPVDGNGCEIDMWNRGWQNPREAIDQYNFDVVNIEDVMSYIVPNGTGNKGGYGDFLNLPHVYSQHWHPHTMGDKSVLPGHPKLLGAEWAIWNDNSFCRSVGICDYELFAERIAPGCAVYAEKGWNTGEDRSFEEFDKLCKNIGFSPNTNPTYRVPADKNGVMFDLKSLKKSSLDAAKNVKVAGNKIALAGGNSFVSTGIIGIAPNFSAEFDVKMDAGTKGEQILFASPNFKVLAVQKDSGKFGIVRDTWRYDFDYKLPENKKVRIRLVGNGKTLTLFVDGKEIGHPVRQQYPEKVKSNTFVFPLQTIGAREHAFKGTIENLVIKQN